MNQEERKTAIRRMRVLVAAACILMLLYGLRLIFLQLVNGDDFKSQATNTTDYKFTVTAARGDIVDSRGERIATSVTSYNVVLNKLLMGDEDLDGMLQKIIELLRANGESWNDTLLISQPDAAGNYTFTAEEGSTRDQKALAAMKDNLGLQQYATANDVMEKLVEDYDLASYPLSWQRTLGGIHYEMQLQAFSNVNNFIMAENVSEATVATIKEHSLSLPGVEIVETSTRSYEQSTVLPHVLGRVGKITAEKWKVTDENGQTTYPLREKGYNMNDIIGISGLESAYEDELRGKDGVETITRNSDGVIVDTALTTVPEPGHTVQLTIDSRFQKAVDKALAENIDMINRVYNTGSMKAAACAAVVLDVKDGSVLAASNYPSFDQNLYATQYSEYSADESLPLFNRALQGLYTPGSTFKPAVAVAALYHDASEILTGDMPTPVKYKNEALRSAYKAVEQESARLMASLQPEALRSETEEFLTGRVLNDAERKILKAADRLSALIKCLEECQSGNREFEAAREQQLAALHGMDCPEAEYFITHMLPCYTQNLDELTRGRF